jgi:hypothetical protein
LSSSSGKSSVFGTGITPGLAQALLLYISGSGDQPQAPPKLLDLSKLDLDSLMLEAGLCNYEDGVYAYN